jgi:hypothetical protein
MIVIPMINLAAGPILLERLCIGRNIGFVFFLIGNVDTKASPAATELIVSRRPLLPHWYRQDTPTCVIRPESRAL